MPDIPQLVAQDDGFTGMNSRVNADLLPPGYVSLAINRRFEDKTIKNRWGVHRHKWAGIWNNGTFTADATLNSSGLSNATGLASVAVNTVVACNPSYSQLVFKNGTRLAAKSVDNTNATMSTTAYSFTAPNPQTFSYYSSTSAITDVVAVLKYRDKSTGKQGLLVASNVARSDGGQGRVYLLRPNQSHLEVPMNGHDFYGRVKLIQCGDSVVMLRPGPARYYFNGTDVNATTDTISLNVTPDLQTGDRVVVGQLGVEKPLWIGSTGSGQGFGVYVNVVNSSVTLHLSQTNALAGTSKLDLSSGLTSANRFYIELQNNTTSYDITQGLESYQNDGLPLIMQASFAAGEEQVALDKGFDRVPNVRSIVAADGSLDTITVPNHNFVPGDQVTISNSSGGGVTNGIYYVYPVDENTLRLFSGTTEETDSLNDAQRATVSVTLGQQTATATTTIAAGSVTAINLVLAGVGYNAAPTVTIAAAPGGGTNATATATVANGKVTGFTITNAGSGYVTAPAVTIDAPLSSGITALTILNQGDGYLTAPAVTISGGAGTGSSATTTLTDNKVSAITVVDPGSGYVSAPTVTIAMPSTLVDITASLTGTIAKSSSSGAHVPEGRDGLYFQNRLLMVYGNDFLAVSDVLDPLHYSRVINDFKLNTGANDRVITIAAFNSTTLVVFKERSILAIENLYGDLSQVRLTEVTREFGCVARDSVVNTGSDLIFLSQRGVVSLKQTEFGISQSVILPLSDSIQNLVDEIDEVNWHKSVAAYFDNRYLLAHPTEGGDGTNDRVLVYNFLNQAWEGYWEGELLNPKYFERLVIAGTERLLFADESGYVHVFDKDALFDSNGTGTAYQIETRVEFRGYTGEATEHKQWTDLHLEVKNWNTRYDLSVLFDGVDEESVISVDATKDRTLYYRYGLSAYNTTNVNDDFRAPYRQDYSTLPVLRCGDNGWTAGLHQQYAHKARLKGHASAIQPVLTTDRGSLIVSIVKAVGIPFRLYGKNDV